eukprot:11001496-Karenia_brevis.AAC.1
MRLQVLKLTSCVRLASLSLQVKSSIRGRPVGPQEHSKGKERSYVNRMVIVLVSPNKKFVAPCNDEVLAAAWSARLL